MSCRLCSREKVVRKTELCQYHHKALENLQESFEKWRYAYGNLDWDEYLKKVAEMPETGIWVKDCCNFLKKKIKFDNAQP